MPKKVLVALAGATLGWSMAAVGVRYAFESGVSTFTVVGVRLGVAAIAASAYAMVRRQRITVEEWRRGAAIGMFRTALSPILFIGSLQYISAGVESILITLIPVGTALLAWVVLGERQRAVQIGGFVMALTGAIVIVASGESGLGSGEGDPLIGGLLALGGVAAAAISGVLQRRFAPHHTTTALAVPMFVTGGAISLLVAFAVSDFDTSTLDAPLWALLLALGLGSTLLPFGATLYAAKYTTAARVSLVAYVAPLISIGAGIVLLDEVLTLPIVIGGGLALTGVVLAGSSASMRSRSDPATVDVA